MKFTGDSLLGKLQLIFITLKLCGVIDWTWPCVLGPIIFFEIGCIIKVISEVLKEERQK